MSKFALVQHLVGRKTKTSMVTGCLDRYKDSIILNVQNGVPFACGYQLRGNPGS